MVTVVWRTFILYAVLMVSMKLMGKRQIGEFEMYEFVTTLFVSELAALPIADPDIPLSYALAPLAVVIVLEVTVSFSALKSGRMRKLIMGKPSCVIRRGVIDQKELKRQRVSCAELLGQLRQKGVPDVTEVAYAIIEDDGMMSVFLNADAPNGISHALVIDGDLIRENLTVTGKNVDFVKHELEKRRIKLADVFLLTVDDKGNTNLIKKKK